MTCVVKLHYDGRYEDMAELMPEYDMRQWTIMSPCVGPDGGNYKGSSRMLIGLKELGIVG